MSAVSLLQSATRENAFVVPDYTSQSPLRGSWRKSLKENEPLIFVVPKDFTSYRLALMEFINCLKILDKSTVVGSDHIFRCVFPMLVSLRSYFFVVVPGPHLEVLSDYS